MFRFLKWQRQLFFFTVINPTKLIPEEGDFKLLKTVFPICNGIMIGSLPKLYQEQKEKALFNFC